MENKHIPSPAAKAPASGWVKAIGIVGLGLVVLVVLLLTGVVGGNQGSGRNGMRPAAGVGAPAKASEATRTVRVEARDALAFDPPAITASPGETVRFIVRNAGQAIHDFSIGDPPAMGGHGGGMHGGPSNSIVLKPGETKEITWKFGSESVEYACHQPGHYEGGMRGRINVS